MEMNLEETFEVAEIKQERDAVEPAVLPEKSKERYEMTYTGFINWRTVNNIRGSFSEDVLLEYFNHLSEKHAPTSLWASYSMLKSTINIKHGIDIGKYSTVLAFLKAQAKGYKPVKARVFLDEEIEEFLNKAPDLQYLVTKVVTIFGILGACTTSEIINVTVKDVELHGRIFLVKIPGSKKRSFPIYDSYFDIVQRYANMRPESSLTERFFLNYQKGKCTKQPIGKNKVAKMPHQIAVYLNLPEPNLYTGHSFRRTSVVMNNSRSFANQAFTAPFMFIQPPTTDDMDSTDEMDSSDSTDLDVVPDDSGIESESKVVKDETLSAKNMPRVQTFSNFSGSITDLSALSHFTFNNCTNVNLYFNK